MKIVWNHHARHKIFLSKRTYQDGGAQWNKQEDLHSQNEVTKPGKDNQLKQNI